jgi:hypothetical protein
VLGESRMDHQEFRATFVTLSTMLEQQNGKIFELATKHLDHQDAQARINQAGWDALQEGIELNKNYITERHELTTQLAATEAELQTLKEALAKAGRDDLIRQIAPAAAIGIGRALENKNPFVANLLQTFGLAQAGALPSAPQVVTPPSNGHSQPEPQVDIKDICTADELQHKPLVCLGRIFGATMTRVQIDALTQNLQQDEWTALKVVFGASEDAQVKQSGMLFFGRLAADDTRRTRVMSIVSQFQQGVLSQLIDRIGGKVTGPLNPAGLSTKQSDQAELLRLAINEKQRLEAENAAKEEELSRLRKQVAEATVTKS